MKNIFKILLLSLAIVSISCEEDLAIIDVNDPNNTLVSFGTSSTNLAILQGTGNDTAEITVTISTISDVDRTFNVNVLSTSTADNDGFSVPSSVTIPAGEYSGTLVVTGNEVNSVTPNATTIDLEIVAPDAQVGTGMTTVRLFLVCPIPADFLVGTYTLVNTISLIGPAFADQNFGNGPFEISVGADQTQRVFNVRVLPRNNASQPPNEIVLSLVCNTISLANEPAFRPGNALIYTESGNNATYDLADDSRITVNYFENPNDTNGLSGQESQFVLVKQ